ncbi:restriction endonuclease subunit S [Methanothrix thermoacetophila]|uniref:restriction endonuclease subunit S n=1 Tax=Methanothrix thermoacetophila TaxID=2224 RepID=UPI00158585BF|nr:restriction endonuclease subunit S [Methanothrix thermoacetophila]
MNRPSEQTSERAPHLPDGYRLTELGPLPAHWRVVRLGEVAQTTSGGTPQRDKLEYYGGHIPWIKSGELDDRDIFAATEQITELGLQNSNAKMFEPGTLLIAMYGATAGKVGILQIPAATNQAICAILPKEPKVFIERFLFYAFIYLRGTLLA